MIGKLGVGSKQVVFDDSALNAYKAKTTLQITGTVNVMSFGATGDGTTDDSVAIQDAIDSISSGTVFFPPKTFIAEGIVPKNNVTLVGYGAELKLPDAPTTNLIHYYSENQLTDFNIIGLRFNAGIDTTHDLVHIEDPTPNAPAKTWYMSTVRDCTFLNGKRGIYCSVPGSTKVKGCYFDGCDVGMEWEQEHFYISDSVFWTNRIGIYLPTNGNHFSIVNGVFAHCTEYGIKGTFFESSINGCSFIDNQLGAIVGISIHRNRISACRFLASLYGIQLTNSKYNTVVGCQFSDGSSTLNIVDQTQLIAIDIAGTNNVISNNVITDYYIGINCRASYNLVNGNEIYLVTGNGINVAGSNDSILNNRIEQSVGIGISVLGATFYDTEISGNYIYLSGREGVIFDAVGTGGKITNNTIFDNGILETTVYSGIKVVKACTAMLIANNVIRNSGSGLMKHAIEFVTAVGVVDTLVSNNVARNMKGATAYVLATTTTQDANIGTVATV